MENTKRANTFVDDERKTITRIVYIYNHCTHKKALFAKHHDSEVMKAVDRVKFWYSRRTYVMRVTCR